MARVTFECDIRIRHPSGIETEQRRFFDFDFGYRFLTFTVSTSTSATGFGFDVDTVLLTVLTGIQNLYLAPRYVITRRPQTISVWPPVINRHVVSKCLYSIQKYKRYLVHREK